MKKSLLFSLAFAFFSVAVAAPQPESPTVPGTPPQGTTLAEQHLQKGLQCPACHTAGTDVAPTMQNCEQCHGQYVVMAEKTQDIKPNPHASHMGDLDCIICHRGHVKSEVYCNDCHTFKSLKLN